MENLQLRTGFDNTNMDKDIIDTQFENKIAGIMITLLEKASKLGIWYSKESGRNNLSSTDILYALQYYAHEFDNEDDLEKDFDKNTELYINNNSSNIKINVTSDEYESDDDNEYDENELDVNENELEDDENYLESDDSECEDDQIELDYSEEAEFFSRCESNDLAKKINFYHDTWSSWIPDSTTQKIMKNSVDKIISEQLIELN